MQPFKSTCLNYNYPNITKTTKNIYNLVSFPNIFIICSLTQKKIWYSSTYLCCNLKNSQISCARYDSEELHLTNQTVSSFSSLLSLSLHESKSSWKWDTKKYWISNGKVCYEALQDIVYILLPPGINFGISLKSLEITQMGYLWSPLDS